MVNITRFSSDNFEEGTAFVPVFPDSGEAMEGVELWIKSSNSNVAIPLITRITNKAAAHQAQLQRTGKSSIDLADSVKDDIDLACAVLVSFKGFTDGDGKEIESSPETIKELMTKHAWLRAQVLSKANDATFFYKSE
ncbi:hypothetical protein [Ignatzschineria sp. LJL83]